MTNGEYRKIIGEALNAALVKHLELEPGSKIGEDMPVAGLGIDSLDSVEIVMEIEDKLRIDIPDGIFEVKGTVGELAEWIADNSTPVAFHRPGPVPEQSEFIRSWNKVAEEHHRMMVAKGFWDGPRNDGEMIALIHSELSEALEALRGGNGPDDKIPEFLGLESELADAVLRIMDMEQARGLNVSGALMAKMSFNATREWKHGKEF